MSKTRKIISEMARTSPSNQTGLTPEALGRLAPFVQQMQSAIAGGHWDMSLEDFVTEKMGDLDVIETIFPEANARQFWMAHGVVKNYLVGVLKPNYRQEVGEAKRKGSKSEKLDDIAWSRYNKPYAKCTDGEQVKCDDAFSSVYDDEDFE